MFTFDFIPFTYSLRRGNTAGTEAPKTIYDEYAIAAFTIDDSKNKMYLVTSDAAGNIEIQSGGMEGGTLTSLFKNPEEKVGYAADLSLDLVHGYIYWPEYDFINGIAKIARGKIDGSGTPDFAYSGLTSDGSQVSNLTIAPNGGPGQRLGNLTVHFHQVRRK